MPFFLETPRPFKKEVWRSRNKLIQQATLSCNSLSQFSILLRFPDASGLSTLISYSSKLLLRDNHFPLLSSISFLATSSVMYFNASFPMGGMPVGLPLGAQPLQPHSGGAPTQPQQAKQTENSMTRILSPPRHSPSKAMIFDVSFPIIFVPLPLRICGCSPIHWLARRFRFQVALYC